MPVNRRNVLAGAAAAPLAAMALGTPPVAAAEGTQGVTSAAAAGYRVGMGIADITGPAAENGMMGYSMPDQKTAGIHLRTRSRAYVVVDEAGKRIVFVNADLGQVFLSVHTAVLKRLASKFGSLYTEQNVLLNATHTHAGCGGYSHYAAYNLSILGFQKQTFEAIVAGICESIEAAHADLKPATIRLGRTELTNASANRSRTAFDRNAAADKAHFPLGIDPAMTVLRIAQEGRDTGAISWFATHATSMTNANKLISGDNKGYASYAWEHEHHGVRYLEGKPGFVASFPQTNAGDMSPNLNLRPGSGPTENEFDNTRIIGDRQFQAAKRAYDSATATISGAVDYRMSFVDMSKVVVDGRYTPDGRQRVTAPAAVGASMLAGSTEDGPGVPLNEGITNPFIEALGGMDAPIPKELADAQAPKVVAVPFGLMKPHPWAPDVLPLQIVRIGQLYLIAAPAEFTIVAGLRLRRTVAGELAVPLENVLLQGYANAYAQYVTTHEEYDSQQYEGASTLYGRYTLAAYQQEFAKLAVAMRTGGSVGRGPTPRDLSGDQLNFQTGVVFDSAPSGKQFGDVLVEPNNVYRRGERVSVEFVTGHPKNDLRRGGTFLEIQRQVNGAWVRHADDGDWSTRYHWQRIEMGDSKAVITWEVPANAPIGQYRVVHHGNWKHGATGAITAFTGTTRTFLVS